MSFSESPKELFRLKLSPTLLSQLDVVGVQADDFIEFVTAQAQAMIGCKSNFRLYNTGSQPDKPVWIMRGYYPETPVFFKLTVVKTTQLTGHGGNAYQEDFSYYVRARELRVKGRRKWHETMRMHHGEIVVMSSDIMKNITHAMENELLGAGHEIKPILAKGPKKPKCMSPKGCKLFRYKKPSNRRKRET